MNKPRYLYRGIKVNYDLLQTFKFYGVDIKPHYEPLIDKYGRKTVTDGNEYGVYMTDNELMAKKAYANVSFYDGKPIKKDIQYGSYPRTPVRIPSIGIVYRIDTTNIDVHKPWISRELNGVYNNGYQGDEWVVEKIPKENYSIISVVIGPDELHNEETIKITAQEEIENIVKTKIEQRKMRLELFLSAIEKIPEIKRAQFDNRMYRSLFRDLFGENGAAYINLETIELNSSFDYIKYLLAYLYKQNNELNLLELKYIGQLKSKLTPIDSIDKIFELLQLDLQRKENNKIVHMEKSKQMGENYSTIGIDKEILKIKKFITILDNLINKNNYKKSV